MKRITREGTDLVYYDYGDPNDPPLLLLHGLGADHEMWQPQIDSYPTHGLRILAPDLRGHGRSGRLRKPSMTEWVDDLRAIVAAENIERYAVAGVSMGGIIAQALAIADGDRLTALVLCDTFADLDAVRERMVGWATLAGLKIVKLFGRQGFAKLMSSAYKDHPSAREYFELAASACDIDQVIQARRVINRVQHKAQLSHVGVPTLHLVGARAGRFFVSLNQKVSDTMPNSTHSVLPDGTDPSNLVAPEQFDGAALPFLGEHLSLAGSSDHPRQSGVL